MELTHRFSVPTPVEETWSHFGDIASLAECFPGATVTSVEGDSFKGTAKVKLGPIALVYSGSGEITERDDSAHRMLVVAKGKDKRGNGTAGATVTLTMAEAGGATDVEVVTDLAITGKPAQFGRGVMQDVSDKLLGQFVDCLEHRLALGEEESADAAPAAAGADSPASGAPATVAAADPVADAPPTQRVGQDAPTSGGPATVSDAGTVADAPPAQRGGQADDHLDLGATVLPVLAKTYWKHALAVLVGVLVLRRLLGGGR